MTAWRQLTAKNRTLKGSACVVVQKGAARAFKGLNVCVMHVSSVHAWIHLHEGHVLGVML
jgi:hypothetical protein